MFDLHTASLKVLEYEKLWYVFFLFIIGDQPILFFRYLDVLHYIDSKVGFLKSCVGALSGVFLCTAGYKVWWMSVTDTHRKSNIEPSNMYSLIPSTLHLPTLSWPSNIFTNIHMHPHTGPPPSIHMPPLTLSQAAAISSLLHT